MPSVGYATLQVIPSVRGIGDELRRQLVGPAGDAGGDAGQAAGEGLRDKVKMGAAAAGAAAGALLVAGIAEAIDQMNITSTLQAQLGATGKDAARYGKLAGQLYAKGITTDVQQGADTIRAVINAGLAPPDATNKQLASIATKMADVANTFGTDMSMQTQAVSAMMKNGLAPNASAALDVITVGMQKLGPNAEDLLETFQEYPVQLRKLGIDSKMALGLFRQGLQGGARDTDIIADAMKEFSIRAIDMSTGSVDAYKALGLNAETMSLQIAKGGKGANDGLQLVLDRLREMKDPVAREAAAVGLFGTQAEELGSALFKLDPGKAADGFGKVTGAAGKLGDVLHSGPAHEIEVFSRALKQGFIDVIGGQVLPVLGEMARWVSANLLPIRAVASVVAALLIPALTGLFSAGAAVVGWLRDMGTWLIPIGVLVGGITLMLSANAIATAAVTAAFSLYRGAILAWTAVQRTAIAIQTAWNTVMALNPIGLVVIALIALGAALVVAYQKSETFRGIVQGAWEGIKTVAMWVWNNALKPAIDGLVAGWKMVSAGAVWLWNVLKPVFSFIGTAFKILATVWAVVMFGPMYLGFKVLGAVALWLWNKAISPVIGWIIAGFKLWWAGVKIYFNFVKAAFMAVANAALWLWRKAISPVIKFIVAAFKLWWAGVKVYFNLVKAAFRAVGNVAKWLWEKAIRPVLGWIADKAKWLWNKGIKPAFDLIKKGVKAVGNSFEDAKDFIAKAWGKIRDIARKPVRFIINTVYNKGIVPVWNKVAGAFGAPKIKKMDIGGWATGGVLPGYTPGRDVHLAALSGGEAVMRPEWTRAVGPGYVNAMNSAARSGGITGVQRALGIPGFADGGIFGWVKSAASKGIDLAKAGAKWLKDGIKSSAMAGMNSIVKPLIDRISGDESMYKAMVTGVPKRMLSAIFDFSDKADKKLGALGVGGKGTVSALKWARTQHGKRYQWGGNGNPSWDCSGFLSAIESIIRGQKPQRRWSTHAFKGGAPPGWVRGMRSPYMVGITHAGVGHTAGTLNKVNVESRGGDGVVVGKRARAYNDRMFSSWYGFKPARRYDDGGWLQPGVTTAVNATGEPEAVLTGPQWRAMTAAAGAGGGLQPGDRLALRVGDREFDAYVEDLADGRVAVRDRAMLQTVRAGRRG